MKARSHSLACVGDKGKSAGREKRGGEEGGGRGARKGGGRGGWRGREGEGGGGEDALAEGTRHAGTHMLVVAVVVAVVVVEEVEMEEVVVVVVVVSEVAMLGVVNGVGAVEVERAR